MDIVIKLFLLLTTIIILIDVATKKKEEYKMIIIIKLLTLLFYGPLCYFWFYIIQHIDKLIVQIHNGQIIWFLFAWSGSLIGLHGILCLLRGKQSIIRFGVKD